MNDREKNTEMEFANLKTIEGMRIDRSTSQPIRSTNEDLQNHLRALEIKQAKGCNHPLKFNLK
jgi:hypothetical protein